jgi:hypothetical protein
MSTGQKENVSRKRIVYTIPEKLINALKSAVLTIFGDGLFLYFDVESNRSREL